MPSRQRAGVEVVGGPQLRKAFRNLGDRAQDLKGLHGDIAEDVRREASDEAPRLSGDLARSGRKSARKTGASVSFGAGLEPYAGPIHFGWRARNIEPQPFLYDVLDDRRDEIAKRYADGIGKLVTRFDTEAPK